MKCPDTRPGYWFPAKRYGWGWGPPCAWQGWVVLGVWTAMLLAGLHSFAPPSRHMGGFLGFMLLMTVLLLLVCLVKGEPPRWRWGGD